jgi:carboxyl-terminal processing protease
MTRPLRTAPVLAALALLLAFTPAGRGAPASAPVVSPETEANITRLTVNLLESSQFAHHPLDSELAGKFLDRYLDALDGTHSLLTQADLAEFGRYRATLAQATRTTGDTTPAHAIFARYLQRLEQRVDYIGKLLKTEKFTFTGAESFALDRTKAPRPSDLAAAQALWRQQVRLEYLQEKLADKKPDQIATTLTKRYAQQLRTMKQLKRDEVLELYLNALAHVYDPHSDYMGHQQMESFSIAMNLKLFGIGALLGTEDGYCKIRELVPGGPAAKSGLLKPGDRITAVAQGNKEPTDIVNMPLAHAVSMIRGPKGTTVVLTILPAGAADGAAPKKVVLVRDEIKLEDQESRARILDWPTGKGGTMRLGVIDLPSFYAELGKREGSGQRSATADVVRLLEKLKAEKVEGIALDLRRNGGGSLEEAIKLTGLFLKTGPMVQTRGPDGDIEVGADTDPAVQYDGPMVVLTSRFSASASEILAGALQDYGRAVVIGDSATFGKGTVQNLMPLARLMERSGLSFAYDPGALKITIRKFYRPGGASTQLKGIASDIVLPSPTDHSEIGESSLTDPLAWDSIKASRFQPVNRVQPYLATLKESSTRRVAAAKEFVFLREEIALIKKGLASKSLSLNEAERRKELAEAKARRERREKQAKALATAKATTYEIRLKHTASPGLPTPVAVAGKTAQTKSPPAAPKGEEGEDAPAGGAVLDDITLNEGVQILADYVHLLKAKGPKEAGQSGAQAVPSGSTVAPPAQDRNTAR